MYVLIYDEINMEGRTYIVYGIECDSCAVRNVSANKAHVQELVDMCNMYELSPVHLRDVAEDFLD